MQTKMRASRTFPSLRQRQHCAAAHVLPLRPRLLPPQASQHTAAAVESAGAAANGLQHSNKNGLPRVVPRRVQFPQQRRKLCGELLSGGLVWLAAGAPPLRNADVPYAPFRPESNFLYATGCEEPEWACLLDADSGHLTLLAPRLPPDHAIWAGAPPAHDDVAEQLGADAVAYVDDAPYLVRAAARRRAQSGAASPPLLHVLDDGDDGDNHGHGGGSSNGGGALAALAAAGVDVEGGSGPCRVTADFLRKALARSRARKTRAEIACLLFANRASAAAHEAAWQASAAALGGGGGKGGGRNELYEFDLAAAFGAACATRGGLLRLGYPPIVGAGKNAAVLHYMHNHARVAAGDLVLIDAGAEFRGYTADITRTFPAGGALAGAARAVYDLTLRTQEAALAAVRPGASWKADVEAPARRVLLEGLRDELGVVKGSVDAMLDAGIDRIFCPHGFGHHLGLDVHDTSEHGPVPTVPLERGFVVTVEPGVYFMPLLVRRAAADPKQAQFLVRGAIDKLAPIGGCRIEDNVAILPAPDADDAGGDDGGSGAVEEADEEAAWLDLRVNSWLNGGKSSGGGGGTPAAEVLNLTEATGLVPKRLDAMAAVMASPQQPSWAGPRALDYNPHV